MSDFIYHYPTLYPGILLKRYKRFFADVQLTSGEIVTAHCPNTGPMKGVYIPGNPVQLSKTDNPKRKLAYTWEMIQLHDNEPTWVGVNTGLPNKIIKLALQKYIFPELGRYDEVKSEVVYGQDRKSRVDFCLLSEEKAINLSNQLDTTPFPLEDCWNKNRRDKAVRCGGSLRYSNCRAENAEERAKERLVILDGNKSNYVEIKNKSLLMKDNRPIYLEVKNTTWTDKRLALFPDTETTRGQKHLRELMAILPQNRGVMLYFINRSDCTHFAPGDNADPIYGKLLRQALSMGLEVLPCRFETTPVGVKYLGLAELQI
ncbi:DNA/RNA nuclease SfsA [Plectonema cf. radiosum LEGE 06105]|uniref:Sugar fermentation stimulation protein homolog n=1 Tax=Plectonema cf. radiosum LEGE 06105 TaxID=945769 RepID=A0A8J7EYV2_9CYAN|nr:DNA/RNA nuclease SfsA [Plectonema radiosum]MBE9211502.1 DNA/RNA nuclease SfsA [Plectonema cf. radiosum LEGE 06105]